jgi:hypothetical protein
VSPEEIDSRAVLLSILLPGPVADRSIFMIATADIAAMTAIAMAILTSFLNLPSPNKPKLNLYLYKICSPAGHKLRGVLPNKIVSTHIFSRA